MKGEIAVGQESALSDQSRYSQSMSLQRKGNITIEIDLGGHCKTA